MKTFLSKYRFGFDFMALVVVAATILPEIVYACIPQFTGLATYPVCDILARIFQAIGCIVLVFVVLREKPEKRPFFDSLYMTVALSLLFGYTAWILFFCGFRTFGVLIFLKVCSCVTLLLVALEKKNALASAPLALYSVLFITSFCIFYSAF